MTEGWREPPVRDVRGFTLTHLIRDATHVLNISFFLRLEIIPTILGIRAKAGEVLVGGEFYTCPPLPPVLVPLYAMSESQTHNEAFKQ